MYSRLHNSLNIERAENNKIIDFDAYTLAEAARVRTPYNIVVNIPHVGVRIHIHKCIKLASTNSNVPHEPHFVVVYGKVLYGHSSVLI